MRTLSFLPLLSVAVVSLAGSTANAGAYRGYIGDATDALESALGAARRSPPRCRDTVQGNLQRGLDDLDSVGSLS